MSLMLNAEDTRILRKWWVSAWLAFEQEQRGITLRVQTLREYEAAECARRANERD